MKIKMMADMHDGDLLVWKAGEVFDVDEETENSYYILRKVDGEIYGVDKSAHKQYKAMEGDEIRVEPF